MKLLPVVFASYLFLAGALAAEEWTKWKTLEGERSAERVGNVQYRTRRNEQRDSRKQGYFFEYQLRMASDSHVAKIALYFSRQDPQDPSQWEEPDTRQPPTVVHEIAHGGKEVSGSRYSPSPTELEYKAVITWQEELTPVVNKDEKDTSGEETPEATKPDPEEKGPETPTPETSTENKIARTYRIEREGGSGGYTSSVVPNVVFRLPLDAHIIFDELAKAENYDVCIYGIFSGTITLTRPEQWEKVMGVNGGLWAKWLVESMEREKEYGNVTSLTIELHTDTEVRYSFTGADGSSLCGYLLNQNKWGTKPNEVTLTALKREEDSGSATESEEKVIHASTTEAKSSAAVTDNGSKAKVKKPHEGYWYDPTDKDRFGTDPMIYVRYKNKAERVLLSVAQDEYGVPKSATPATMSNYNEQLHILITKDRTTHLRP